MAYINQENKQKLMPNIKKVLKKYNMKGTVSISNHMKLVVTLTQGKLDIIKNLFENDLPFINRYKENYNTLPNNMDVNVYHLENYTGEVYNFLTELEQAMKGDEWYDDSDIQIDYFNTAYYIDIKVGKYNKPYLLEN